MDYGFHPPTVYFPLVVPDALMIEPTEPRRRKTLDAFCDAMLAIAREAAEAPELVHDAPALAARQAARRGARGEGSDRQVPV